RGKAIAFCDADDQVGKGWLAAMGAALRDRQFVAARLDFSKLNPPESAEAVKNPQHSGLQKVEYPPHLPHASGGTLGIAREAHDAVGGFDEELPYLEDTDYCFRVQREGIPLQFVPEAVVHYRLKERHQALFSQARHWGKYNVLMYKRYRENMRLARPWRRHLSCWYALLRRAPFLFRPEQRYAWTKALGTQLGVLQGAIRYRVPPVAGVLFSLAKLAGVGSKFLHE
ncbi:MAG TPA: glycosyltransferase family 2 protein, partial [Candidatus Binatia bacterium]|nr:glycosyltransferase family 2 protein [Candidatus Binatia bacterium]